MSFRFSPLFLRRSPPLKSSLRSFTPSTCPLHPIHNAGFEDEVLTLTPAPLFAGQDRSLRRYLPAATVLSLLEIFELIDEIDAFLDELLQDRTASRMREAEIAEAEASSQVSQEIMLPPRHGSSVSIDIWMQSVVFDSSDSDESDDSSLNMPSIIDYIDLRDQLTNFQIKVSKRPRRMSEPTSPKTV